MANVCPIPTDSYKVGFIEAGKMAESIDRGVVKSGIFPASRIRTAHSGSARRTAFESIGVTVFDNNTQVVEDSDVIIFSVKPQVGLLPERYVLEKQAGVLLEEVWAECERSSEDKLLELVEKESLLHSAAKAGNVEFLAVISLLS